MAHSCPRLRAAGTEAIEGYAAVEEVPVFVPIAGGLDYPIIDNRNRHQPIITATAASRRWRRPRPGISASPT
jgi:hypothetical protein